MDSDSASSERSFAADWQETVFSRNFAGRDHAIPLRFDDLEREALKTVDRDVSGYISAGAGRHDTLNANVEAFDRWRILPRVLTGNKPDDLSVDVVGQTFEAPVMFAPTGSQGDVHDDGELATAGAASALALPLVLSSGSSYSLEEVARTMGETPRWFQLYLSESPDLNESLVTRAEDAGYSAIVITVDMVKRGWRPQEAQRGYSTIERGMTGYENYFTDPTFVEKLDPLSKLAVNVPYAMDLAQYFTWLKPVRDIIEERGKHANDVAKKSTLTWEDVEYVQELTDLPVVLKGIVHPDDAAKAVDVGVDGIVVSNHGGGHLDGAIASLDALPGVAERVGDDVDVLFDSGIRSGADVFKALALGAKSVLVGRPYLYGLAIAGEEGAYEAMANILAEFEITLANSGLPDVSAVDRDVLVEVPNRD